MPAPKPPVTQYEPGFKKQLTREQRDPGEYTPGGAIFSGMAKRNALEDGSFCPSQDSYEGYEPRRRPRYRKK